MKMAIVSLPCALEYPGHLKVPTYIILIFVLRYVYTSIAAACARSAMAKAPPRGDPDVPRAGRHAPDKGYRVLDLIDGKVMKHDEYN